MSVSTRLQTDRPQTNLMLSINLVGIHVLWQGRGDLVYDIRHGLRGARGIVRLAGTEFFSCGPPEIKFPFLRRKIIL